MFGPFKSTISLCGGYLWKSSPRLSPPQKARLRKRMRMVDSNIEVIFKSLAYEGKPIINNAIKGVNNSIQLNYPRKGSEVQGNLTTGYKKLDYLKYILPKESEMSPKDKYTTFDKKAKDYRKLVLKVPKWTKKSFRENPIYH